jgi:hypothetical protein
LPKIKQLGLVPARPSDTDDETAVYLFETRSAAEEAVLNWLGDRFAEEEELVLLIIDPTDLEVVSSTAAYEVLVYDTIPFSSIVGTVPI